MCREGELKRIEHLAIAGFLDGGARFLFYDISFNAKTPVQGAF